MYTSLPGVNVSPSSVQHVVPDASDQIGGNINYASWASKTNWLFQVEQTTAGGTVTASIDIYGMRPSGVEDKLNAASISLTDVSSFSIGGEGGDEIYGPFCYFRFNCTASANSPTVNCYVTGWNYGDIWDSQV